MATKKVSLSPVRFHLGELEKHFHALDEIQFALEKMSTDDQACRMAYALRSVLLAQASALESLVKSLSVGDSNVVH